MAELTASLRKEVETSALRKLQTQMQQTLIKAQEVGDEKLQAVNTLQELIENQARLLETDSKNLGLNFTNAFLVSRLKFSIFASDFGNKDQENTEPSGKEVVEVPVAVAASASLSAAASERQSKRARRSRLDPPEEAPAVVPAPVVEPPSVVETRAAEPKNSAIHNKKQTKKKKRKAKHEKEQHKHKRQQHDDSPQV